MALQSGTASSGRQAALDAGRPPPLDARGLAGLGDIELLALATGRGVGHAAAFLERLGGLRRINSAGVAELARAGLPAGRATALAAACELLRRVAAAPPTARWVIRRPADLADHLLPGMALLDREELRVALLDTKNVVTALRTVYLGSLAGSPVRVGEVFRDAVRENAAALLVVHNHPSGDPTRVCDEWWEIPAHWGRGSAGGRAASVTQREPDTLRAGVACLSCAGGLTRRKS
jgi:DNA repair protein RadC